MNHDTNIYEFGLPEGAKTLGLPVCACLLLCAPGAEHEAKGGGDAVRPYTPVSPSEMEGKFQLLIKVYRSWGNPHFAHSYRPAGAVSNYIDNLKIGDKAKFKHISFNVKVPYPFTGIKSITMLAVGAGIAPMIQALYKLLDTEGETTEVTLLYGNRSVKDILLLDVMPPYHHLQTIPRLP